MNKKAAVLIYPHQLYEELFYDDSNCLYLLIEDSLYFGDPIYPADFHKQKLLHHRLSMAHYKKYLESLGKEVEIIEYNSVKDKKDLDFVFKYCKDNGIKAIHVCDPTDFILEKRITRFSKQNELEILWYTSPNFLTPKHLVNEHFNGKKSYFFDSFYMWQRKRLNILVENDKPAGGNWNYDKENRKKLPKLIKVPKIMKIDFSEDSYFKDAKKYIETNFSGNPGLIDTFNYPVNFIEAKKWLRDFIENKLGEFGPYEDAIDKDEVYLYHSVLTPILNIGLLQPQFIVNEILKFTEKNMVPLNSVEGFIRQIIGWREYMRAMYLLNSAIMRKSNFLKNTRQLSKKWYDGTTGIAPIDDTIHKLLNQAYTHHIERLMIVGNFMLLCEIHPDQVYKWFMEMYIDSYDWVMVPNIYGMSQYADGGSIVTKPYISSSKYILKMSNYKKDDWCDIWDSLYWYFIAKHRNMISKNPRMSIMVSLYDKMSEEKKLSFNRVSEAFLETLG